MQTDQRGAASLDIALAISFSIGGVMLLLTLITPFNHWRDALTIKQQLSAITHAASLSYQKTVMQSRCLSQIGTMSLNHLISEQRLPNDINQGLWQFEVNLIDLPLNTWTRPSQIETVVTFQTQADLQAVIGHLPPGKVSGDSLTTHTPLRIDITDNWAHFNKQTGCYE